MDIREWAGTTEDMFDLHRFTSGRRARCNPEIRTPARTTGLDRAAWPWERLRTREEIETQPLVAAGRVTYRFCPECDGTGETEET